MCSVVHTWRSLFMVTMEDTTPKYLCNSSEAIRKRKNRVDLKEKRREDTFVNRYVQIKYPDIYTEIIAVYKNLANNYPGRADLTKTYFFKKWQEKINQPVTQQQPQLLTVSQQQQPQPSTVSQEQQPQSSTVTQQHQPQISPSKQQQSQLYVPYLPILQRVEIMEEGQQNQEETVQESPKIPSQEETVQEPPQIPSQEAPQIPSQETRPESNDLFSGMTLEEMNIAAEEIVQSLQSDRELMDIVENFDLPEGVWNNELSIPDYVLEEELEWW